MLMDGRPLPAFSERLNERGAVITKLPTVLPEERGRQRAGRKGDWVEEFASSKAGIG